MVNQTSNLLAEQFGSWLRFFSIVFPIFVGFVTLTSWIHSVFSFPLLPVFENTLEGFRQFTHSVFENLFYRWFSILLEYITYYGMVLLKPIFNWIPVWPDIAFPSWVLDVAIISIVLLRSQKRAMKDSDPLSTFEMSRSEREEWNGAIQSTSLLMRAFISMAWRTVLFIYFITKIFTTPFKWIGLKKIGDFIGVFLGGVLMLGIAYLAHDLAISYATREIESPYATSHRGFMKITTLILVSALLASGAFFVINGYFVVG